MTWIRNLGSKLNGRGAAAPSTAPLLRRDNLSDVAPDFPGFQSSAADEFAPGGSDECALARLRLRDAYTPAQPVRERLLFAGRRSLLANIIRAVEDERAHTIIYGPRGIGKTSMLHVIAQAAREARYLVSYISCGSATSFDEMFRAVAGGIPVMFHADYGPTAAESEQGTVVADLLPETPISPRLASDICAKVAGTRVLAVIDEFDRGESAEFQNDIVEFLKNLSDRSVRVQLVIAGVAEDLGDLLEAGVLSHRNVIALEVARMSPAELRDQLLLGAKAAGMEIGEDALKMLVEAANGMPYLASLLAQHAGLVALSANRLAITAQDVLDALGEALMEMKARIRRSSWVGISRQLPANVATSVGLLAGKALGNGRVSANAIKAVTSGADALHLAPFLDALARDGRLLQPDEDENGGYRFVDEDVLPYLWLRAVQQVFQERGQPAPQDLASRRKPRVEG